MSLSLSPTRTRTRSYDLRELRSGRKMGLGEEVEAEGDEEEGKQREEAEEEVDEGEAKKAEKRRSQRLKRKKRKSCMHVYSDEEEGRVRFDLDSEASEVDDSEHSEEDSEEESEEERTERRRSERLSQTKHRSFVVPDDPMDDDRDDGDYVDEDEEAPPRSPRTNLPIQRSPRKDSEAEEEENEDSLSVAKLVRLVEEDSSSLLTHLMINEKVDILLLDEDSSFSMLLAFAALRRSFEGLWCSRTDETSFMPLKLLDSAEKNYDASMGKHRGCGYCRVGAPKGRWYNHLKQSLSELTQGELGRLDLNFWAHQLQAAASSSPPIPSRPTSPSSSTPIFNKVPTKYIWLNPPSSSPNLVGKESVYFKKFLLDCSLVQEEGGCFFITLPTTNNGDIEGQVDVGELKTLGERLGYRCFVDRNFVRDECVHNGFHTKEGEGWTTLIFIRVEPPEEAPTPNDIAVDNAGLPTTLPRPRYTVVMEVDSQTLPPPSPSPPATAAHATSTPPPPSLPQPLTTSTSTIPSPPPSPLASASSVRRSSRQHGPLLYGTYRDLPLAEDVDMEGHEEEQEEGKGREKRSQTTKKAKFWVDVPNSRPSSSRASTSTAMVSGKRKAGNKAQGWGQTTLKGAFISQKKRVGTTAKPKSKQPLTPSLSALVPSPPSPSPSASTSTSKGKERERERVETIVTISSMVVEMGKGYRVGGGGVGGGGSRSSRSVEEEREKERCLSPEYLPPSPPAAKRRRLGEEGKGHEDGDGRDVEEGMEVDPPQPEPFPQNDINPEEEAQARDFLNFQDDDHHHMVQDPPPPSSSREYRPLKRLKRAGSFASGEGGGDGRGSVHSSHATLVDPEGSASPAVVHTSNTSTVPGPASSTTASAAATVTITTTTTAATGSGLRRSRRQLEKETNIDRFNRNRGRNREEAIVVDTDSDTDEGEEGDDMDHDSEEENQEEHPPLLPLHQFVDIESRDAGLTYPNVHRYGTEYGRGQPWPELVDVELE